MRSRAPAGLRRLAVAAAATVAGVVTTASPPAMAADLLETRTPYPGVTYTRWQDPAIPARLHVITVDLASTGLAFVATTDAQRGLTPAQFGEASGAHVVINGDFFSAAGFAPRGLAMGEAIAWPGTADDATRGLVAFDRNGARTRLSVSPPNSVVLAPSLDGTGVIGVVSGGPMLVSGGIADVTFSCSDLTVIPCEPAPRTAVAVDASGNTGWLVVVDGWQADSHGMTAPQLAAFLDVELGAHDALMLDVGSASALWIRDDGGVVSSPSDGVERAVANHLGIVSGGLAPGTLRGVVRERDGAGPDLMGALLTLDDGQTVVYDGTQWSFSVAPRYVCATASIAGYHSETQCVLVEPGAVRTASLHLRPNSDFIDAGPEPDAGPPDAALASPTPDAGDAEPEPPGTGCGCTLPGPGSPGGTSGLVVLAAILLRSRVRRRRRANGIGDEPEGRQEDQPNHR